MTRLWHGGPPGLRPGDVIAPDPDRTAHLVDGCHICEARRQGQPHADDDNDPSMVYVTTDREYARLYAAGWPRGDLYVVQTDAPLDTPSNDPVPSWAVPSCRVVSVYDRCVTLSKSQLRRMVKLA